MHGGQHVSRSDGAYANFGREFERHALGEFDHPRLRCVVIGVVGVAHDAVGGGSLQNHSAARLDRKTFHHVASRGLGNIEDAREIYGDHLIPFFGSDVKEVVTDADAGIVDEHVDSVHHADRISKRGFHLHQVGDVGDDRLGQSRQLVANGGACFGIAV